MVPSANSRILSARWMQSGTHGALHRRGVVFWTIRHPLTAGAVRTIVSDAMGCVSLQHQAWFAYYFSPPALLAGHRVLKR